MRVQLAIAVLLFALGLPGQASAAVKVWDGGGADSNWMTKENWVGDVLPIPNEDSLEFPEGAARKANSNNFPSGSLFLGIHFSGATGGYALSGNLLLLSGSITSSNTSGTNTISFAISLPTDLTLSGAGNINITGLLSSTGGLTKSGTGIATLTAANTYSGSTTVLSGTLIVNGAQSNSAITMTGGTLGGVGTVGALGAYAGTVSPGTSYGTLSVRDTTMTQETSFRVELEGAGGANDRLNVTGAVNLGGATLNATLAYVPQNFSQVTIIINDGTDAVAGTFAGLPEGSTLTIGNRSFTISYVGGTGNDVVLTAGPISFIAGTVTNEATGAPVAGASIGIYSAAGVVAGSGFTNAQGMYTSQILPTGSYFVSAGANSSLGLVTELYNNLPCPNLSCGVTSGTPVSVTPSGTPNINFALAPGGTITGTVTNAATGAPVGTQVNIYSSAGVFVHSVFSNAQGVYTSQALPTGSYLLTAQVFPSSGLLWQLYANHPCPYGSCTVTSGTPVSVTAPNVTTNINFALQKGGTITGVVTNATTGAPVGQVSVKVYSTTGLFVNSAITNAQGVYTIPGLETGSYFAWAEALDTSGLVDELFNNLPCPNGSCNVTSGTPIAVTAPNTTPNINFPLAPAPLSPNDTFATALVIDSLPHQSVINTTGATTGAEDPVVPCASSATLKSVWYVFTPAVDGPVAVNTSGSNYDTVLSIYTGSPGSFTPVGCHSDISSNAAAVTVQGLAGQSLAILVTTFSGPGGLLVLNLAAVPGSFGKIAPANGSTSVPSAVTLSWGASTDAQAYEYCVDKIHNGVCNTPWVSVGTATSVQLTGLTLDIEYSWQVRAVNTGATIYAQGSASAFWSFTPSRLPLVDLNADGLGDAFAHNPATGAWQFNVTQADGTFVTTPAGSWNPGWHVAPAIFDSDALTDFFLFNETTGQWQKVLTTSTGFTLQATSAWWPGWKRFVMDLDGDGLSDFFLYDPATGVWFQAFSTPAGFTYQQGAWNPGWEIYPMRFNDDAFEDMFLIDRATGRWFWVLGAADGVFTYPLSEYWLPDWQLYPGDFNGDGLSDLFLYHPDAGEYYVAFSTGTGFSYFAGYGWAAGWTPYVGDFDGDGQDDLFLHGAETGVWFQMISDGTGNFTSVGGQQQWVLGWNLYLTDFNGDGRADILLYDPATGAWFQARNLVNGTFSYTNGTWAPGLTVITRAPNR